MKDSVKPIPGHSDGYIKTNASGLLLNSNVGISNKTRIAEITAAVMVAVGKFVFMDWLKWWLPFVLTVVISWTVYVIYRSKKKPGVLQYWGFRMENSGKVLKMVLPFGISVIVACIVVGLFRGTINLTWHIIPLLILYPVWGTIQQFLLIALTAGNLQDMQRQRLPKSIVILIAAALFGIIHYPHTWLIVGSFVLAIFYGYVYLKERNLFVLGLFHGWLGAIFFYTVVDRDPFVEIFGVMFGL